MRWRTPERGRASASVPGGSLLEQRQFSRTAWHRTIPACFTLFREFVPNLKLLLKPAHKINVNHKFDTKKNRYEIILIFSKAVTTARSDFQHVAELEDH